MSKKKSWAVLIVTLVIICATVFCAAVGFGKGGTGSASNITLGLDLRGGVSVTYEVQDESFTSEQLSDTVYKLQLRVAEYSTDATVYQEGTNRITVEIPGVYDTETVIEELGRPGSLQFATEYEQVTDEETGEVGYYATEDGLVLTGANVSSAQAGTQNDSKTGSTDYVVQLVLDDEGTAAFAAATSANVGNSIYILYDGAVISSPTVKEAITSGSCIVEGMGTYEAASTLASTIRIGSLSLELKEISSKVVSAKLGDNAVSTSLIAGFIGLALIMIFMIIIYRIPGVAAAIAMVFYSAAMLVLLNAFNLTLTISGIAGIILSIGMAVDGNVIINTRIKEELNAGQPVDQAIRLGFKKSMSAILDGNITTLIVAVVLLIFGSGTVKGFGYTLAFGIVLSVFTSLVVSRLIVNGFYGVGLKGEGCYAKVSKKARKIFDFVGKKAVFIIIACVCILAGVVSMIANGASGKGALNYSIEFIGGVSTTVDMQKDVSIDDFNGQIKSDIESVIGSSDIEGQKVTGTTQYVIKTPELSQDQISQLKTLLVDKYGADAESFEIEKITATVSRELQRDAFISLAIATACMLIYIWIRFRKFKVAASSVIALIHDVCIVVAFYALFRLSVGNSFIACILSIVGYSINATIIVFDRVRENLTNPLCSYDLKKTINLSINQTLTRTLFTSLTTFIVVLFLYILGVESMRAFALPLAVGIIAGTYSSVLISGNLLYIFTPKAERYDDTAARSASKLMAKQSASDAAAAAVSGIAAVNETAGQEVKPAKITANPNRKKKKKRKQ